MNKVLLLLVELFDQEEPMQARARRAVAAALDAIPLVRDADYRIQDGRVGDPLKENSTGSYNPYMAKRQQNMLSWKLSALQDTISAARKVVGIDSVSLAIARDTLYIGTTEYAEHRNGETPMLKGRASQLIDAFIDCIAELENDEAYAAT